MLNRKQMIAAIALSVAVTTAGPIPTYGYSGQNIFESFKAGEIPEAHPVGTGYAINEFSYHVAERQYEKVCREAEESAAAPQYSAEEKALCEEACRAEIGGGYVQTEYLGQFDAYAYCKCGQCCDSIWNGLTFMETVPEEGRTVAVDPRVIPLGTKLLLEYPDGSYREVIAEDTGEGIKGNKLDVYISDHQRALEHGVQKVKLYKEGR